MAKLLKFPKDFYWGASTSSHQVEGGNENSWSVWEKENAERLARKARDHLQIWQLELFPEAHTPENYISGIAVDHYNRFNEDFDIAKSIGMNAHRFSIEWSRVEPSEGMFDEKEILHYEAVISALKSRGIEPFVTLWHWTLPLWLEEKGGWQSKDAPRYFTRFAKKIVESLGEDVKFWITINEPLPYSSRSYMTGTWPPQKKNFFAYSRVLHHLVVAHRHAYNVIKVVDPDSQVGIAKSLVHFDAHKNRLMNKILKRFADWWWNYRFLNNIKGAQDFIGVNHYSHNTVNYGFNKNADENISDMEWELYPESMYKVLLGVKRYKKPVYITENGLADSGDIKREKYLKEILRQVHRAIESGVDVMGYLHWSLLDNFEWDNGFWPRFGLVEIDYKNKLKRRVRESAKEYAKIIGANAVEEDSYFTLEQGFRVVPEFWHVVGLFQVIPPLNSPEVYIRETCSL